MLRLKWSIPSTLAALLAVSALAAGGIALFRMGGREDSLTYLPRMEFDSSGYTTALAELNAWETRGPLEGIADSWQSTIARNTHTLDNLLERRTLSNQSRIKALWSKAMLANFEGKPREAYEVLARLRDLVQSREATAREWLFTVIFYQGVTALRCGETENCLRCRGESACILPITAAAVHTDPRGSRQAVAHFTEYLSRFPNDLIVRWLLNVAQMTLGEYPDKVDPRFRVSLDSFFRSEFDMGRFRDVSYLVGLGDRLNISGGAIMDDFDNDGLLDLVVTSSDPTQPMALYRNKGDGAFEEQTRAAGLSDQLGGLNCVQADYNNDGLLDIFICRGAWFNRPMRPSLLRNNGDGAFTDVTQEAGLMDPVNSISASWADYDNDGWLDLFICCERQNNHLYHNKRDGTFEEVALKAGVAGDNRHCKGVAWLDYDNDDYPDLFLNNLAGEAQLFHNNRDGGFTDVTGRMGIWGPRYGFPCWAWDFDNDGWLDLFAATRNFNLTNVIEGLEGRPHERAQNKLYRNQGGKRFQDVTQEAGLELEFAAMGSNFGDFDGDGYLDFYLGTGDPHLYSLFPNRMFKNVGGKRFADITCSSGTGHLQKGHGVACGDWRRDGNVDLFLQAGGAVPGDSYHNVLFRNPGHGNSWLTVKLIGRKTNRSAIGARIKVVTAGPEPLTVYRHVSSGSSFGANPLQQTIGLGKSARVALLEIHWPTSGTTRVFHDVAVNQAIEVTESAPEYNKLDWKPIAVPK